MYYGQISYQSMIIPGTQLARMATSMEEKSSRVLSEIWSLKRVKHLQRTGAHLLLTMLQNLVFVCYYSPFDVRH